MNNEKQLSESKIRIKKAILIKKLESANKAIFEAERKIVELNASTQVDYCTDPNISSLVDGISITFKHIQDIWYQKK